MIFPGRLNFTYHKSVAFGSNWWKRLGATGREQLFTELLLTELYACAYLLAPRPYYPPIREKSKFE